MKQTAKDNDHKLEIVNLLKQYEDKEILFSSFVCRINELINKNINIALQSQAEEIREWLMKNQGETDIVIIHIKEFDKKFMEVKK
jgi:nucleoside 2-deoxyribosyltransferase